MHKLYILTLALLFTLTSCEYYDSRLLVINNSSYDISYDFSYDTIPDYLNTIDYLISARIKPGKSLSQPMPGFRDAYSRFINASVNKKLNLYFFNIDTLQKYKDLQYIFREKLYTRYSLSEDELNRMNWTIKYPLKK